MLSALLNLGCARPAAEAAVRKARANGAPGEFEPLFRKSLELVRMSERMRLVSAAGSEEDRQFEAGLRPRRLADFTGQTRLKENLRIAIDAARKRGEAMDHVLLYGPPGLGKTTLASIIAQELEVAFHADFGSRAAEEAGSVGDSERDPARARCSSSTKFTGCCPTWRRCSTRRSRISISTF